MNLIAEAIFSLDRPPDPAGFRVPLNMMPNFEVVFQRYWAELRKAQAKVK
jgi:hypothetical protein